MYLKKTIAIILAGGKGTRIKNLLYNIPKPMALINKKPFIYWLIKFLLRQGINNIIISTGYLSKIIENYLPFLKNNFESLKLNFVKEKFALGTGGALINVLEMIDVNYYSDYLIFNGDSIIIENYVYFLNRINSKSINMALLGVKVKNTSRFGSLKVDKELNLIKFNEKASGKGLINSGIYFFSRKSILLINRKKPLSIEHDIFPAFLDKKAKIAIIPTTKQFLDIGIPKSIKKANIFIKKNYKQF